MTNLPTHEPLCAKCQDPIDESESHLVECFEETDGDLLCSSCWDNYCEAKWVRMEEAKIR